MTHDQKNFYYDMLARGRGYLVVVDGALAGAVMFFVGYDDNKYMHGRAPWTILEDEPYGDTLYIDQLLSMGRKHSIFRQEYKKFKGYVKRNFPNVRKIKWARAPVQFRKHNLREGKPNVYCQNIK